ncbi:antigen 5 like allergen Cul n 1-like [Uranotaenia lowii]|uniref:antigen 5 like allergen Cul n 1-like n=1 Tax=Uranotaenia lowii TaxID=190385 RepID=UPI0024796512|nr:antigen 5 like allergen Cul n 1-like [Uranotaenia lowii]
MYTQSDRANKSCRASVGRVNIAITVICFALSCLVTLTSGGKSIKNQSNGVVNYCGENKLCPDGTRHVVCNGYSFGSNCTRPMLIKMTQKFVNLILNFHNEKRNKLACGSMRRYASASSMQKLRWNDELAHMAEYNAKSCHFAHDQCHNTPKFRHSGQSIGMKWFHGHNYTAPYVVRDLMRKWYVEHKMAKQHDVDLCKYSSESYKIGHFTQMIRADTTEVGCALVRFQKHNNNLKFVHYYLVCNYSEGNVENKPIYKRGEPCSGCKLGCAGPKFRCLCRG